jgi:tetratricopeptide (TPR) repeat protein
MKKIRLFFVSTIIASSPLIANAQTLNDAIKLTTNEQFETADAAFKALLQSQPNNGEYYFYYGENYFKNENVQMANTMYQKGADVNATNPFPYVGLGKIQWYQGKQTEAKANFFKATTFAAGKNAIVLLRIAEVYISAETKDFIEANKLLDLAQKIEPKNPEVYILRGDAVLEQNNDGSKAITMYEQASSLDPKSVKAILRIGQLWNRAKNYTSALDYYKKASLIDSSFAPAYREKAEIYFRAGQYNNAVAQYKRYLQLNNNCSARSRYAGFLNQAKQYKESVDAAIEALKCDLNNDYLNRYMAYDYYELKDYVKGLASSNTFFSKATGDVKIISQDYENRAKLNAQLGADSLAILDFKKVLEMDTTRKDLNNDIANAYMKMKKYAEAIDIYKKKISSGKVNANDYYGIGRAYYYTKDFINADSSFAQIIKSQPDLYLGYLWRAKVNEQMDPKNEKWLAKPFFETYISKLKPEELTQAQNKNSLIEAYNYLAAYYASKKDCPNVKVYLQKVLDLDSANAQAKKVIAALKC